MRRPSSASCTRRFAEPAIRVVLPLLLVLLAAASSDAEPPSAPAPVPYGPLRGMEPSGRIPKAPLPLDLPEPERWRYVPEGRLKPGNVFERFLVSSFASPQFFFEEDVGAGAGIALNFSVAFGLSF